MAGRKSRSRELEDPDAEVDPDVHTVPSRSQRKRDAAAVTKLGEALTKLTPRQLAELPLPVRLGVDGNVHGEKHVFDSVLQRYRRFREGSTDSNNAKHDGLGLLEQCFVPSDSLATNPIDGSWQKSQCLPAIA